MVSSQARLLIAIALAITGFAILGAWIASRATSPVDEIERFLNPPERWLVADYGFHGDERAESSLSRINTPDRAEAMLRLLDRVIAATDEATIPEDLGAALGQIGSVAPELVALNSFHRLEALAQRKSIGVSKPR